MGREEYGLLHFSSSLLLAPPPAFFPYNLYSRGTIFSHFQFQFSSSIFLLSTPLIHHRLIHLQVLHSSSLSFPKLLLPKSLIPQVSHSPGFSSFAALSQTFDLWLTFHEIKVSARIRDVSSVASSRRGHLWGVTSVSSISPSVLRNLLVCQKGKTSHQFILPKHCSGNSPWQGCPELHPQTSHQTILQSCFSLRKISLVKSS